MIPFRRSAFWRTLVGTALLVSFFAPMVAGQSPPSSPLDDWVIAGPVVLEGTTSTASNVVIQSGGSLEIRSGTLKMEPTGHREPRIIVGSGGLLFLNGTPGAKSVLTDGDDDVDGDAFLDQRFQIHVDASGVLQGIDCLLRDAGEGYFANAARVEPAPATEGGLTIRGRLALDRCEVADMVPAIEATNASVSIRRSVFRNNLGDFDVGGGSLHVVDSEFSSTVRVASVLDFRISNSSFRSIDSSGDSVNFGHSEARFGTMGQARGRIEGSEFLGYRTCIASAGRAFVQVTNVRFSDCDTAIRANAGAHVIAENVSIDGGLDALESSGGTIHFQNSSIEGQSSNSILLDEGSRPTYVAMRNATWDHSVGERFGMPRFLDLTGERFVVFDVESSRGRAVGGVVITASQEGMKSRSFVTDHGGKASGWIPFESYLTSWSRNPRWSFSAEVDGSTTTVWVPIENNGEHVRLVSGSQGRSVIPFPTAFVVVSIGLAVLMMRRPN